MGGRRLPGLSFEWGAGPDEIVLPESDPIPSAPSDNAAYRGAMGKAGKILARRAHSEKELRDKLGPSLDSAVGDAVVARLKELGLLDDEAFARQWVQERAATRGKRALEGELAAKGISAEVVTQVLGRISDEDEEARAHALAARHAGRVAGKPLERQAASILQMLLRKGFEPEVAEVATRAVLPPEGWD